MTSSDNIVQRSLCPITFPNIPCFRSRSNYDLIQDAKTGINSLIELKQKQYDSLQVKQLQNRGKIKELVKVGNRKKALRLFKTNKVIEKRMELLQGYMDNLELQAYNIEETDTNKQMVSIMQTIKKAMKKAGISTNVDDLAETVDDINDMNADLTEVQDILSNNVSNDSDELEEEFNKLFEDDNDNNNNSQDFEKKAINKTLIDLPTVDNNMSRENFVNKLSEPVYS